MSKKTERFSYNGGCGICECMRIRIEGFKRRAGLGIDKRLRVVQLVIKCYLKPLYHKETEEKGHFKFKTILYTLICDS